MRLQAVVGYALTHRGRAIFVLATCTIFMLMLITISAMLSLSGRSGNQLAANSAAIQDATAKLEANGCQVRTFAVSRCLVPFAEFAPSFLQSTFIKTEFGYVAELQAAQLTDDNIELMNKYPEVDLMVLGSAAPDASLLKLSKLTNLDELRIETTAATQAGLAALQLSRPDLAIDLCDHQGRRLKKFELPRQFEWNSPELIQAGQSLIASGCMVTLEARAKSTLPEVIDTNAPQGFAQPFRQTVYSCLIRAGGKLLTPANIELMSRYPALAVEINGSDVTDNELQSVARIPTLKTLFVESTSTTDDGLNAFHLARPDVAIVIGSSQNPRGPFQPTPVNAAKPATSSVK